MHAVEGVLSGECTSGSGSFMVMTRVEMPLLGGGKAESGPGGNDTRCS